jgi:hypothetical protein
VVARVVEASIRAIASAVVDFLMVVTLQ